MKKTSLYIDAPISKRGRKLQTLTFDFAILIIVNIMLLFGIDAIVSSAGGQKGVSEQIIDSETSLREIIKESHLDEFDEESKTKGPENNAKTYVLRLTYGSLLHGGKSEDEISKKLYSGIDPISAQNELCHFYYCSFKNEKNTEFLQEYRSNYGENYYRSILTEGFNANYVEEGFPYLSLESAEMIDESYRNAQYSVGVTLRNSLQSHYQTLLENGIDELKKGYSPYIEAREAYEASYQKLWLIKIGEGFGAYGLATIILFFLLPTLFHNGLTPSGRIFKLPYRQNNGNEPGIINNMTHWLILTIEYLLAPTLSLLAVYGSSAKELLSISLFGSIPVFTIMIYSFILMLLSYLFTFIPNQKRQTLSEFAARLVQVEGREIERGN